MLTAHNGKLFSGRTTSRIAWRSVRRRCRSGGPTSWCGESGHIGCLNGHQQDHMETTHRSVRKDSPLSLEPSHGYHESAIVLEACRVGNSPFVAPAECGIEGKRAAEQKSTEIDSRSTQPDHFAAGGEFHFSKSTNLHLGVRIRQWNQRRGAVGGRKEGCRSLQAASSEADRQRLIVQWVVSRAGQLVTHCGAAAAAAAFEIQQKFNGVSLPPEKEKVTCGRL